MHQPDQRNLTVAEEGDLALVTDAKTLTIVKGVERLTFNSAAEFMEFVSRVSILAVKMSEVADREEPPPGGAGPPANLP